MNEPATLTDAIGRLQVKLESLDWTDQVYGRVAVQDHRWAGQDRPQLLPMLHLGNGEYKDCRPNDEAKSVVFFFVKDPEKNDFTQERPSGYSREHVIRPRRVVSCYGWVNLERLTDWDDSTGFVELIKVDLKQALKSVSSCVASLGDFQDGPLNEVYKPFQVTDLDRKYDRWPFACFRQDLTLYTIEKR